ncbi:MAG: adenylate/guanylate cyclase domain-containing protein [Bacteroidota bacterium]
MNHFITIISIYLVGINCYFLMWYLGSDGEATKWIQGCYSFSTFWWFVNMSTALGFLCFVLHRSKIHEFLSRNIGNGFIALGIQAITSSIYFILAFTLLNFLIHGEHILNELILLSTSGISLSLLIYHHLLSLAIVGLYNLNGRLGISYSLFQLLSRLKLKSRQVELGFMFIDLNHSTTIAEKITNKQYSELIKSCFELLDELLKTREGLHIYQYVGDEVIVYWDLGRTELTIQSIQLFERFKEELLKIDAHFLSLYGMQPTFKCSIHGGNVTHAELGSGIIHQAFHGDVLNTASRMLTACKKLQTDLVLSETVWKILPLSYQDRYVYRPNISLNGKRHLIHLYHLDQSFNQEYITISKS